MLERLKIDQLTSVSIRRSSQYNLRSNPEITSLFLSLHARISFYINQTLIGQWGSSLFLGTSHSSTASRIFLQTFFSCLYFPFPSQRWTRPIQGSRVQNQISRVREGKCGRGIRGSLKAWKSASESHHLVLCRHPDPRLKGLVLLRHAPSRSL